MGKGKPRRGSDKAYRRNDPQSRMEATNDFRSRAGMPLFTGYSLNEAGEVTGWHEAPPSPEKSSRPTKSERRAARKNPQPKPNPNVSSRQFLPLGRDGRDSSGRSTAYDMGNGYNNYGSGMAATRSRWSSRY